MLTIDTGEPVRCLSYSPDGKRLISGSEHGTVHLWNPATGKKVTNHSFYESEHLSIEDLAYTPEGDFVAFALSRGEVILWTPKRGNSEFHSFGVTSAEEQLSCMSISPSGKHVAIGKWNRTLLSCTRDPGKPDLIHANALELNSPIKAVAFLGAEENLCITCFDGSLHYYDREEQTTALVYENECSLESLTVLPGTNCAIVGDGRGLIHMIEIPSGKVIGRLAGHEWVIYSLAITSDGKYLLSGSADGTVRLWRVESQKELKCFRWHSSWVTSVAISPDDMTAVAGSNDGTIVMWDLGDE